MSVTLTITSDKTNNQIEETSLPDVVTLEAVGSDTSDPGALFNYSWYIIDNPTGSSVTLSSDTGSSVTFTADEWGTYRIFCIAQNSSTLETSSTNPVSAPLNSFIDISVLSEKYSLEKPAKSQRNWHPKLWHLIDTVENITIDPAGFDLSGKSEIATPFDIATALDKTNSQSGEDFLTVTSDQLYTALEPLAGGSLSVSGDNLLRERIKDISFEKLQSSSVGDLTDFSLTGVDDGYMFTWNASAGEIQPVDPQTLLQALEPDAYFSDSIFLNQANNTAGPTETVGVTSISFKKSATQSVLVSYDHDNDKVSIKNGSGSEILGVTEAGVVRFNNAYNFPSSAGAQGQILKVDSSGNLVYSADESSVDGITSDSVSTITLDSGYKLIPAVSGQDLGSTSKRFEIFGTSGDFTGNVDIDGLARFSAQDKVTSPSEGTLQVGSLGAGGTGSGLLQLTSDTTQIIATHSDTPTLTLTNSFANSASFDLPQKGFTDYTYTLPETVGANDSFVKVELTGANTAQLVPTVVTEKIVYSTHVSREIDLQAGFDGSGNLIFGDDEQACIWWVKNTTGSTIELDNSFIHVGRMLNLTLSFSLVHAVDDAAALSNSWTQVGSEFTLTNSSGADNVVGQALATITTNKTILAGEYIGIVCTDIPAINRLDRRIAITFECNKQI
jgi:hypothetical protein